MNTLKLAALFAVAFAGTYSFAESNLPKAVNLDNQARSFGINFTAHMSPCDREIEFNLDKMGLSQAKQRIDLPENCYIDRITVSRVYKQ